MNNRELGEQEIDRYTSAWLKRHPKASQAKSVLCIDVDDCVNETIIRVLLRIAGTFGRNGAIIIILRGSVDIYRRSMTEKLRAQHNDIFVIQPASFKQKQLAIRDVVRIIRSLDNQMPCVQSVLVQGLELASTLLETRQFRERALVYHDDITIANQHLSQKQQQHLQLLNQIAKNAVCLIYLTTHLKTKLVLIISSRPDSNHLPACSKPPSSLLYGLSHIRTMEIEIVSSFDLDRDCSVERCSEALLKFATVRSAPGPRKAVCFSGHDFKFIDPFFSHLKATEWPVFRDKWSWSDPLNAAQSETMRQAADVIFCEWGLANAVWHSHCNCSRKPLFIRIHLQEISERARKFGLDIKHENVTLFIFVSSAVRDKAVALFNWPAEKTVVIPNFLLTDEYLFHEREQRDTVVLGMVGIAPQRKRFDRAVKTLQQLCHEGVNATLRIKGHRPENLAFMQMPGREPELEYYNEIYSIIDSDPLIKERVAFDPWGNDVAIWYREIDVILSPSDFESFHYALADGVLSGCLPVMWPWDEASRIYTQDWIVQDPEEAAQRIKWFCGQNRIEKNLVLKDNRKLLAERYGHASIFNKLINTMNMQHGQAE